MKDILASRVNFYRFIASLISMRKFNFGKSVRLTFSIIMVFAVFSMQTAYSQYGGMSKEGAKQEAETRLQKMTPDEIEATMKKYGLTQAEAEGKAKALGIDLETYLRARSTDTTTAATPQTQVNIQIAQPQTKPDTLTKPVLVQPPELLRPTKEVPPVMGPEGIPYFGYNLFKGGPTAFESRPNLADNSYIVGEGDVLRIGLWGDTQSMSEYQVDTEGRIIIQPAGPVLVAGYTLDQAKAKVIRALSQSLSGLIGKPPTTFLDLTIARLRPVHAFIMGEVVSPGTYSLSSFTTVFNALFTSGGPLVSGGMREVRLMRNGKVAAKVDLYDYLIGSDKSSDVRLNDNDIVYVPLRGKTVGIRGAVLRSAYFELLPGEQLKKLLEFSGGIRSTFYLQRIQIDRIVPFTERKVGEPERKIFDIDFSEILKSTKDYKLEDGDIVTVYPILEEKKNYVKIEGAVWRPGRYQLEKISTLKDLVKAADGLLPDAYPRRANVVRTYDDKQTAVFYVNIDSAMQGFTMSNFVLQPRDSIRIFSNHEIFANPDTVTVQGMAKRPGKYALHTNLTLYDVINDAVGLNDTLFRKQVYLQRADLVRIDEDRYTSHIITFNLWDLFQNRIKDTLLFPGDRIIIYPINAVQFTDRYVDIAGKVKTPGRYRLSENMTVIDLLMEAGGYTEDAWTEQAEVSRLERGGLGLDSLSRIIMVPIPDFFNPHEITSEMAAEMRANSFKLKHRDEIFIKPNPKYVFHQNVKLNGEVEYPGVYVLSTLNDHLSDIVKRAGGLKKAGYAEGGKVFRGGLRLRINIDEAIDNPSGRNDIILQGGDSIFIPKQPFLVQVGGEVNNPGMFSYVNGKSASFYIKESGGVTDSADFVLITYPTGMTEKVGKSWWSSSPDVPDGSSIYVTKIKPEPPEPVTAGPKTTTFDFVKDILAIAVSAVTVIVLATKL